MKKDLVLVIDMQNVYGPEGAWCCPKAEAAAGKIKSLLASGKDLDVIFTQFLAAEEPVGVWKDYNLENAEVNADPVANRMMDTFAEEVKNYPLYSKSTYSSLEVPEVRRAAEAADHVVLTGVVAECCVLATAMALIDAGASVIYLTDGVAGISDETEKATELVLAGLEPLHVRRMTVEEYLKL